MPLYAPATDEGAVTTDIAPKRLAGDLLTPGRSCRDRQAFEHSQRPVSTGAWLRGALPRSPCDHSPMSTAEMLRIRIRTLVLAAALVVVAGAIAIGMASWPRRLNLDNASTHAVPATRTLQQSYLIRNESGADVRVVGLEANVPHVRLVTTNIGDGVVIPPHHSKWLRMTFHISDCHDVPYGPLPVHLRIARWYGTQTVNEQDHGSDYEDALTACGG